MALGAILRWGVQVDAQGADLDIIGVILMIVGALGLLLSLLFWSSFAPFGARRQTVVREDRVDPHRHA